MKCEAPGCYAKVEQPATGRRRRTCSAPCRARKYRAARKARWKWGSKTDQWYTPPDRLIAWAEEYGPFDLDPAADPRAPAWPLIARHWTMEDDGLAQEWSGRVWCNPPYGRTIGRWTAKAAAEVAAGRASIAVLLVPARTDTAWWWAALEAGATPAYLAGRIRFIGEDGQPAKQGAGFPSALLVFRDALAVTKGSAP